MAASNYFAQVQQLYIAYFGRPADPIGQEYWATQIDAAKGSIASVIAGFSASTESAALFGNKSSIDKVTAIYQNAFGRAPEAAGLKYWVDQLDSGKVSQAQASWTIQQSAGPGDAAAVQNKLTAAQAFTAQIDTAAEIQGYQGSAAADSARAFLKTVTADNATATAAVNGAAAAVTAATANGSVGTTFTLTTGIDNLVGDGGNNVFTGDNTGTTATVTAGDQINGGAGTDTFNYFTTGGATVAPQLTAVENVNLIGGVTTVDLSGAVGLQQVTLKNTTVAATSVTVGAGVAVGLDNVQAASETFKVSATQTAATLNVVNGTNVTGTVDLQGAALTTLNVVSAAGAANTIASLQSSTGTETTLNVSGAGNLTIGAVGSSLTTINASTATGNTSINAAGTGDVTYTGGAGNDTIDFGATFTKADKVDGGAGTDTLALTQASVTAVNAYTDVEKALVNANLSNLEVLKVTDALTSSIDAARFDNINSFVFAAGNAAALATLSNVTSGVSVELDAAASLVTNVLAVEIKDATLAGNNSDVVNLTLKGSVAGLTDYGVLNAVGVDTLNISSTKTGTISTGNVIDIAATSSALDKIVVTGSHALDISGVALVNSIAEVDASGLVLADTTANGLTVAIAAGGTNGVKITGSNGVDNITGSAASDIINGGAGNDVITGGAGADVLTGGAGSDKFIFGAGANGTTAATADIITDFVTKVDTIAFGAAVLAADVTKGAAVVADFAAALAAANLVLGNNGGVVGQVNLQQVGTDTYAFYNDGAVTGADQVVKLSGVALAGVEAADFVAV